MSTVTRTTRAIPGASRSPEQDAARTSRAAAAARTGFQPGTGVVCRSGSIQIQAEAGGRGGGPLSAAPQPLPPRSVSVCADRVPGAARIYFSDRLYSEEELPPEFKLFLPIQKSA